MLDEVLLFLWGFFVNENTQQSFLIISIINGIDSEIVFFNQL